MRQLQDLIFSAVIAFCIVWLQIFALSACMIDQTRAYQIISGHTSNMSRMPAVEHEYK